MVYMGVDHGCVLTKVPCGEMDSSFMDQWRWEISTGGQGVLAIYAYFGGEECWRDGLAFAVGEIDETPTQHLSVHHAGLLSSDDDILDRPR